MSAWLQCACEGYQVLVCTCTQVKASVAVAVEMKYMALRLAGLGVAATALCASVSWVPQSYLHPDLLQGIPLQKVPLQNPIQNN